VVHCVSVATTHDFDRNLILEQHRLRYGEVIGKERWSDVFVIPEREIEFDRYDTAATEYLVSVGINGHVDGVVRSNPTTMPYMLGEAFPYLSSSRLPEDPYVFEASRLVVDRERLAKEQRAMVVNQLVLALLERGLQRGLSAYVGLMLPKIWASTFQRCGWEPQWLGPETLLPKYRQTVRAALLPVSENAHERVRTETGLLDGSPLTFGPRLRTLPLTSVVRT
jgi:N-acyl-L-homoserine lactone synthetase